MRVRLNLRWLALLLLCVGLVSHAQNNAGLAWQGDLKHRFLASHGRHGFLFTLGAEGAEGYLYPFRVFHDLRITFRTTSSGPIEGQTIAHNAIVTPTSVTRLYAADGLRVRETLFVPLDEPVLMLLYEVESGEPLTIHISFRPDLDLMWPGGIGGQTYGWDEAHKAFTMDEPSGTYHGRIGSPAVVAHSEPADRTHPWNTDTVLSFDISAKPHEKIPVIATIGLPQSFNAQELYAQAITNFAEWMKQSAAHYEKLLAERTKIETGDRETDDALAWATIAMDQAEGCNPDLGCGLLAGYGPTFDTRRPQYAWFFGGDALVTSWALEADGAHDETLRALSFLRKYQSKETGAIWHEISQAANFVDWFHKYPFIYRHTDISPLYLLAMRSIWHSSGDRELLQASWPSLEAAWRFCLAHVDAKDGLIVIPPDQSGVNENEADRTEKELPLEMTWAAGANAIAELAAAMNDLSMSEQAKQAAAKAKASLAEFWDPAHNYFFEGLLAGNRPFTQQMASPVWGVAEGLFPPAEEKAVLDRLEQPAFTTPWGLRSIPSDDPHYEPDSYAHGSVWPLGTEEYIMATLRAHRPEQAWPMWQSLVKDSYLNSPGHIPEVLSGSTYRKLDAGVPEQTWSSAALIIATVRGILGLEPDAPNQTLRFEPHLPPGMNRVKISEYRLGTRKLDFDLVRDGSILFLKIANDGEPFELTFAPMVSAPGNTATVDGKKVAASVEKHDHDTHATVTVRIESSADIKITSK